MGNCQLRRRRTDRACYGVSSAGGRADSSFRNVFRLCFPGNHGRDFLPAGFSADAVPALPGTFAYRERDGEAEVPPLRAVVAVVIVAVEFVSVFRLCCCGCCCRCLVVAVVIIADIAFAVRIYEDFSPNKPFGRFRRTFMDIYWSRMIPIFRIP